MSGSAHRNKTCALVCGLALALLLWPVADAAGRMQAREVIAERVAPDAALDKAALARRSQEHHAAGRYAEALADLKSSCSLETDAQVAELCLAEVADYAKTYNLPR